MEGNSGKTPFLPATLLKSTSQGSEDITVPGVYCHAVYKTVVSLLCVSFLVWHAQ